MPDALELLDAVVAAKEGGADRPGQRRMAEAVAGAIDDRTHLLVQAGPGTGKSFGYLVPLIASGKRAVVSTATKSLQDQLTERDLPFLAEALAPAGVSFSWAAVKGRSNYLCMARLTEVSAGGQASLFADRVDDLEVLVDWVGADPSGDRDDLPQTVADEVWSELTVTGTECPGREACPQAASCFAMAALDRAAAADIVVVNHHLYGANLMAGSAILPDHEVVVFDEGHHVPDTMSTALGLELSAARVAQLRRAGRFLAGSTEGDRVLERLGKRSRALAGALRRTGPGRVHTLDGSPLAPPLTDLATDASDLLRLARKVSAEGPLAGPRSRLLRLAGHTVGDIELVARPPADFVMWTESRGGDDLVLRASPVEVGEQLTDAVFSQRTAIVTSATLSVGRNMRPIARRLGLRFQVAAEGVADAADTSFDPDLPEVRYRSLAVDSPFDFEAQARIYVANDLPPPNSDAWGPAAARRVGELASASGGRALVLTTSYRMIDLIAEHLRHTLTVEVLAQGDLPKRRLVERFEADETSVLVATLGFWEGIDVVGRSLELVVLDKIPFPRPDDPLWQARREAAEREGLNPFQVVDLPRAAVLVAQGAGRLIRSVTDRGVVALLDSRMATRRYGRTLVASLPPMPGTTDLESVCRFLAG